MRRRGRVVIIVMIIITIIIDSIKIVIISICNFRYFEQVTD